jgi:hypothetical protein
MRESSERGLFEAVSSSGVAIVPSVIVKLDSFDHCHNF